MLHDRLLQSPYYEPDHTRADIFWIPHQARGLPRATQPLVLTQARTRAQMPFHNVNWAPQAYEYIRSRWPYLNRSIAARQTRHFITQTCDQGPGSCSYADRAHLRVGALPSFWNPADKERVIGACACGTAWSAFAC